MTQLWHCADARSFRALWALEELGLPYELKLLPFPPRMRQPEYLDINPLGTIPFLVDGEETAAERVERPRGDRGREQSRSDHEVFVLRAQVFLAGAGGA